MNIAFYIKINYEIFYRFFYYYFHRNISICIIMKKINFITKNKRNSI